MELIHDVDDEPGRRRKAEGCLHYVALSIVGVDRVTRQRTYMRARCVQEKIITESPFCPVHDPRATQVAEFTDGITDSSRRRRRCGYPTCAHQPVAADQALAEVERAGRRRAA